VTDYPEGDVRLAALEVLSEAPSGLTTTELRDFLTDRLAPAGHLAELVASRGLRDTYFDQRVRNLTAHRKSKTSLGGAGLVTKAGRGAPLVITEAGRAFLTEARRDERATENDYRSRQWSALRARGGPNNVPPATLSELKDLPRRARRLVRRRTDQPIWA